MAEEYHPEVKAEEYCNPEVQDRGMFDFMGKKEETVQDEVLVTEVDKLHIAEAEEKKHGLVDKLHRSHSSSSSSSSDEEEEAEGDGENKEKKKKKKKGLKEKIEEKLHGDKEEGAVEVEVKQEAAAAAAVDEDTTVVVEKVEETVKVEAAPEEEKKGFLDKIKEKFPGHKKPAEEVVVVTPPPPPPAAEYGDQHTKEPEGEKKGFLEKIKEKLPGYHKSSGDEGEKTAADH